MSQAASSLDLPPFKDLPQKPPKVTVEKREDGSITIESDYPIGELGRSVPHLLVEKAAEHPDRNFIGQRTPEGPWRFITYGDADAQSNSVAQALLYRGLGADTPLMILSGNSIEHAVMMLGAMKARVPVAPVSVAYSLLSGDHAKLKHVFATAKPAMIFVDNADLFAAALNDLDLTDVDVVALAGAPEGISITPYSEIIATTPTAAVDHAMARITHDTVAKYLFTSGSTGMPKGVIQNHRMMMAVIAAQEALREEEPDDEVPQSLDWMPWNHISAGNISFNGNLNGGGTLYLDAGKPIPGMFDETIRNLREVSPAVFGSAPIAFGMLAEAMEKDPALRKSFFAKLRFMGYGGATLSQDVYDRMQALAIAETGLRIPFTTMYGATETQGITVVHWATEKAGLIGLPLPGITLKLVPNGSKLEVRVKGPTVTPGYLNRPDLTEEAFDGEGFYKLGDAAKFLDANDPTQGLVFDGRVTEDFKLSSGTWVSVGTLRAELIGSLSPLLQDAVICGQDKNYIAALAWPNMAVAAEIAGAPEGAAPGEILHSDKVQAFLREKLAAHNKAAGGSSTRVKRLHLMTEPPSIDGHEITDKGYINQRATLERRAALVDHLYSDPVADDVVEV